MNKVYTPSFELSIRAYRKEGSIGPGMIESAASYAAFMLSKAEMEAAPCGPCESTFTYGGVSAIIPTGTSAAGIVALWYEAREAARGVREWVWVGNDE